MTEETTYHVPATTADMRPPKPAILNFEAENFLRAHWDEVKPFYQAIAGEIPSMHGSSEFDEFGCVLKIQETARNNGFALLGQVPAAKAKQALRVGYKRTTGHSVRLLQKQRKQIEHQD